MLDYLYFKGSLGVGLSLVQKSCPIPCTHYTLVNARENV
jgi:hypothetical protein